MWAIPPVWFLVVSLLAITTLTFALYSTVRSMTADDAEWERQRRRLHSLNRPTFPPVSAQFNRGNLVYAGSASAPLAISAYGWMPGAKWPVSDHGDVSSYA